jgi:hypothetical protein
METIETLCAGRGGFGCLGVPERPVRLIPNSKVRTTIKSWQSPRNRHAQNDLQQQKLSKKPQATSRE